jgi:hypothetical protein
MDTLCLLIVLEPDGRVTHPYSTLSRASKGKHGEESTGEPQG